MDLLDLIKLSNHSDDHDKKEEMIEKYNRTSHFYDNRYKQIQYEKFRIITENLSLNMILYLEDKIILDGGAGTGLFFDYIKKYFKKAFEITFSYIGTDISLNMLNRFKKKLSSNQIQGENKMHLILADLEHLPLRENSINSIFLITSLQNLPNPHRGLVESIRVGKSCADVNISILRKKLKQKKLEEFLQKHLDNLNIIDLDQIEDLILMGQKS
ncbi:MAG: putative SAM-dependent methyltransferase [Promethearchaeota archaeon]|nr:MAG: putative SAM-dependent methyltransferase [Candidatus Lokiarchaeota archaeon]